MNLPQRKKASAVLFRNCRVYLREELKILAPDIVISQGNEAKTAIQANLSSIKKEYDEFAAEIILNEGLVFWLHTFHPANWGAFNRQRRFNKETQVAEGWVHYAAMAQRTVGKTSKARIRKA